MCRETGTCSLRHILNTVFTRSRLGSCPLIPSMAILKKFTFSCRNSKFSAACMEPECPSRGAEEISANGKTSCFKYNKKGGKFWAQWRNRERCYFILSWAWNKNNSESPWGTELQTFWFLGSDTQSHRETHLWNTSCILLGSAMSMASSLVNKIIKKVSSELFTWYLLNLFQPVKSKCLSWLYQQRKCRKLIPTRICNTMVCIKPSLHTKLISISHKKNDILWPVTFPCEKRYFFLIYQNQILKK